jgi:hypothetical protein
MAGVNAMLTSPGALTVNVSVSEICVPLTPSSAAETVTATGVVTVVEFVTNWNVAVVWPAGIVGIELELDTDTRPVGLNAKLSGNPPAGAGSLIVTVAATGFPPRTGFGANETEIVDGLTNSVR